MQFTDSSIRGVCANMYCTKGANGTRQEVAIRDLRNTETYCSQACGAMTRYKKRYRGTNAGPLNREFIEEKMTQM